MSLWLKRAEAFGNASALDLRPIKNRALLQRHVVNSEDRWQRDVVRAAELNPNCLSGERTEIERPSQDVHSSRAAVLITKRRKRREQRPGRTSYFNEETIED